eukprot:7144533-Prymnesium_polylepis.1
MHRAARREHHLALRTAVGVHQTLGAHPNAVLHHGGAHRVTLELVRHASPMVDGLSGGHSDGPRLTGGGLGGTRSAQGWHRLAQGRHRIPSQNIGAVPTVPTCSNLSEVLERKNPKFLPEKIERKKSGKSPSEFRKVGTWNSWNTRHSDSPACTRDPRLTSPHRPTGGVHEASLGAGVENQAHTVLVHGRWGGHASPMVDGLSRWHF